MLVVIHDDTVQYIYYSCYIWTDSVDYLWFDFIMHVQFACSVTIYVIYTPFGAFEMGIYRWPARLAMPSYQYLLHQMLGRLRCIHNFVASQVFVLPYVNIHCVDIDLSILAGTFGVKGHQNNT